MKRAVSERMISSKSIEGGVIGSAIIQQYLTRLTCSHAHADHQCMHTACECGWGVHHVHALCGSAHAIMWLSGVIIHSDHA